jgi:hypothetical protein
MSAKKLSADVREKFCTIVANGKVGLNDLDDEKVASYQDVIDDTDFWYESDISPQILEMYLGFWDGPCPVKKQYIFKNCAYIINGRFTPEQEKLLIQDDFDSERRKFDRLRHKFDLPQHTEPRAARTGIPEEVRFAIWRRDSAQCSRCGSRERLEYDHIVPVSLGGSNTVRNIELLCEVCNRSKGGNIQ